MKAYSAFDTKSPNFLHPEPLDAFLQHYELFPTRHSRASINNEMKLLPLSLTPVWTNLEEMHAQISQAGFPKLTEILTYMMTIGVTSAGCERSFSVMKLILTHLRSTCSDQRLSHLAIIAAHPKRAKDLNLDVLIDQFSK